MFLNKKIQRAFDWQQGQTGQAPMTEESLRQEIEKGDLFAMIMGAYRAFWPVFLVLAVLALFLLLI